MDGGVGDAADPPATSAKGQNPVLSGGGEQRLADVKRRSMLRRQPCDQEFVVPRQSQMRQRFGAKKFDALQARRRRPWLLLAMKQHIFWAHA